MVNEATDATTAPSKPEGTWLLVSPQKRFSEEKKKKELEESKVRDFRTALRNTQTNAWWFQSFLYERR